MIIFLKTGGEVAYVSDENIHLGSDKANSLFVVAPYAPASSVCVAFKLPNGKTLGPGFVENQGVVTFDPEDGVYVMQNVTFKSDDGSIPGYTFGEQKLSAWSYDIQSALTGVSGTLGIQLFIFADGRCISTDLINVPINVGVNNLVIPSIDTTGDVYQQILYYLTNIYDKAETAVSLAKEARVWANGTYEDADGDSQPVAENTPQYQNNAKYYAGQAAGSATAAAESAASAAGWAIAANKDLATANNRLNTAEDRLDNAEDRLDDVDDHLDNIDYILEQFGFVKEQIDSSTAFVKSIPAMSDLYAYLNSVGGKTYKSNQLLPDGYWKNAPGYSGKETINGVEITNNRDGTFKLNGTATSNEIVLYSNYSLSFDWLKGKSIEDVFNAFAGDYSLSFGNSLPNGVRLCITINEYKNLWVRGSGGIINIEKVISLSSIKIYLATPNQPTFDNLTVRPMLNRVCGTNNIVDLKKWSDAIVFSKDCDYVLRIYDRYLQFKGFSDDCYVQSNYQFTPRPDNRSLVVSWDVNEGDYNSFVHIFVNGTSASKADKIYSAKYSEGKCICPLTSSDRFAVVRFSTYTREQNVTYSNIRFEYWDSYPFEPFINGLQDSKVTALNVYSKSLFDFDKWIKNQTVKDGQVTNSKNNFVLTRKGSDCYIQSNYEISVVPNKTLVLSWDTEGDTHSSVYVFVNGKNLSEAVAVFSAQYSKRKCVCELPYNAEYIIIRFALGGASDTVKYFNIKLGYLEETYPLPKLQNLTESALGHGLTAGDSIYANTVDLENNRYKRYIPPKKVFDGDAVKATGFEDGGALFKFPTASLVKAWDITHFNINNYNTAGTACLDNENLIMYPYDQEIDSVGKFNNWLKTMNDIGKPVEFIYATEPKITDISTQLEGFDPVIPVEGGGFIEFVNERNSPVPSTITYNIIQEA